MNYYIYNDDNCYSAEDLQEDWVASYRDQTPVRTLDLNPEYIESAALDQACALFIYDFKHGGVFDHEQFVEVLAPVSIEFELTYDQAMNLVSCFSDDVDMANARAQLEAQHAHLI